MKDRELEDILYNKKLLLYGIGNQFKESYKLFKEKKISLFDSDPQKWGKRMYGHIIHSPKEMDWHLDDETGIIITSINQQYEIATMLIDKIDGSAGRIFMYTSPWYESKIYKNRAINDNWNKIINISSMLADRDSQQYYMNAIMARRERNPLRLCPNPNSIVIGEYGDKVNLKRGDSIIDCGAYTGDTAELYMKRLNGECKVYAIEPYEENYKMLKRRIDGESWQNKVKAFNCAVGGRVAKTIITYNEGDFGMAINLSNECGEQKQEIFVETIDHLMEGRYTSYIKMDIEGEEKNALEGARETITRYAPRLMISGYHKIEDFWEIPEKIWSINGDYKIYVGHAPGVSTEMEFYCVDENAEKNHK